MLDIKVDDYKLTSDGVQIVVQRKHLIDPTNSPKFKEGDDTTKRQEYRNWKYCGKVEQALDLVLRQRIMESDATTLKELRDEIISFKQEISRLLGDDK